MDWFERWLTNETAEPDSQRLIDEVSTGFRGRESNPYAELTLAWRYAAYNLSREWFRVSIGWMDEEGEHKETIFLSEAKGIGDIPGIGPIVPITHWLGSLHARLRQAALQGRYPRQLAYGPPGREVVLPVGPLVEYRIENNRIREAAYHSADVPAPAAAEPEQVPEPATARSSLRAIWQTIDPEQDSNFRWPFHGIYVLSGGPGTGKTSVALLRIRFLIEQQRHSDMTALLPVGLAQLQQDFFTEQDTLVVVWERHLQPYLKESLVDSRFADVPVQFYDDWLNVRLRAAVPIGDYRIEEGAASLEEVKKRFTEKQLGDWIRSWDESARGFQHPLAAKAYECILQFIDRVRTTHRLAGAPQRVAETWEVFQTPLDRARFRYSPSGINNAIARVKTELNTLANNCARPEPIRTASPDVASARPGRPSETPDERLRRREGLRAVIPSLQDQLEGLRKELQDAFQNRYPQLLLTFYDWETDRWILDSSFSSNSRRVLGSLEKQRRRRRFS